MQFPGVWGPKVWQLIHMSALCSMETNTVPVGAVSMIKLLPEVLPCPACKHHCQSYVDQNAPTWKSPYEYWKYTVDMHNAVNARIHRVTLKEFDAKMCWYAMLKQRYGATYGQIGDTYMEDVWRVVLALTYINQHSTDWAKACLQSMPFTHTETNLVNLWNDSLSPFQNTLHARNVSASLYGRGSMTALDAENEILFMSDDLASSIIADAMQRRHEDHSTLLRLQSEIDQLTDPDSTTLISLSIVLAVTIAIIIALCIKLSRK